MNNKISWIAFRGCSGSDNEGVFQRVGEYTLAEHPHSLRDIILYLNSNRDCHDLCISTDGGARLVLKRKIEGESISPPQ